LNSDLEKDIRNHQQMLLVLFNERKVLRVGSRKTLELDKQICKVENVVRSYQTVSGMEPGRSETSKRQATYVLGSFLSKKSRQAQAVAKEKSLAAD
jgi:hypothetical protein